MISPRRASFSIELPDWVDEARLLRTVLPDDRAALQLAIDLAAASVRYRTGGPFGALITDARLALVSIGVNMAGPGGSALLHAEIVAIARAHAAIGSDILPRGHTLFTSCEPCALCLGAVHWSGVGRVVWAATREDAERVGFDEGPVFDASHRYLEERGILLNAGPLRQEAAAVLLDYVKSGGRIYNA